MSVANALVVPSRKMPLPGPALEHSGLFATPSMSWHPPAVPTNGGLVHAVRCTKPNISFTATVEARRMS